MDDAMDYSPEPGRVVAGCVCLFLSCALAASAGLGGGGLNLPILLVVVGFPYKQAVVLSLFAVLGNHCSQTVINFSKSHPVLKTRPLIYWELILIIIPSQLAGTNLGTNFNSAFPVTPLIILAMFILIFAGYKSLMKGMQLYRQELQSGDNEEVESSLHNPMTQALQQAEDASQIFSLHTSRNESEDLMQHRSTSIVSDYGPASGLLPNQFLWKGIRLDGNILGLLLFIWCYYVAVYAVLEYTVSTCSFSYFLFFGFSFIGPLAVLLAGSRYLSYKEKRSCQQPLVGDVEVTESWISVYLPLLCFAIGVVCTLLGLGTAELTAPVLLLLKILPVVSSASTSMISLLYTSSSIVHYGMMGAIDPLPSLLVCLVGVVGGFTGRTIALFVIAKYKKNSFICFMLVVILFLAFVLLVEDIATKQPDWHWHALCAK